MAAPARETAPVAAQRKVDTSGLDAALFYQLLLAELQLRNQDPGDAYALVMDAANRTKRQELYRHAVNIALQARAGNAALDAANAWASAYPEAEEAHGYKLRILLALDRPGDIGPPLRQLIELTPADKRRDFILALPTLLARTSNRNAATQAVRQGLGPALAQKNTTSAAWHTLARLQLDQPDRPAALESVRRALQAEPNFLPSIGLALDLMEQNQPGAEALVRNYLARHSTGTADHSANLVQLGLSRVLLQLQRYDESQKELDQVLKRGPELPDAWLMQGALHSQMRDFPRAQTALQKFLDLTAGTENEAARQGRTQALLQLAQNAEQQNDYAAAMGWLDRITDTSDPLSLQVRRAQLLARQGQLQEARTLLQQTPETAAGDAQRKALAEAHLLRDFGQTGAALDVLTHATQAFPNDPDLMYERAMLADKAGQPDLMEEQLRELIRQHPDHSHAYNALGYSLADRNERLDEAKTLIQKALQGSPNDPFMLDSLGWVEYRLGRLDEAQRILADAFRRRPDAEIAAHLGEVLWQQGEQDEARAIWRQGQALNPASETLHQTLQRLQVQP
ncbi:MAG TPA: tetratricopeptide repeat protein [Macromonas sp.]|nr:tetratricopeptide repeat protein [Macromonas sp.]